MTTKFRSLVIDKLIGLTNNRNHIRIAVMHAYFDMNSQLTQNTEQIVRFLLKQLVFQMDELPEAIGGAYDLYKHDGQEPEEASFVSHLKNAVQQFSTVYLVLDSLDQINEHGKATFCDLLMQLPRTRLRMFLTLNIESAGRLEYLGDPALGGLLRGARLMEITSSSDDIKKYIEHQIRKRGMGCPESTRIAICKTISSQGIKQ
jgi:hypothetical protein